MTAKLAAYLEAGKALDPDEREIAALSFQQMDAKNEDDQGAIDQAWRTEISDRVDDIMNDTATLVDANEHYAGLRAKLAASTR